MTFIIVTGDPSSGKTSMVQRFKGSQDIIHEDVRDHHRLEAINQRYKNHEKEVHWIIIDTETKLYKENFEETLSELSGEVIEIQVINQNEIKRQTIKEQ